MKALAGAACAFLLLLPPAPASAAGDPFAAACEARGTAPASCACQAKLARSRLDKAETRAAISGMKGDQAGFQKAVAAMGEKKAEAFRVKLSALGRSARETCF